MTRRIFRRIACLLGRHRFEVLYGDTGHDARRTGKQYERVVICVFCRRMAAQREAKE